MSLPIFSASDDPGPSFAELLRRTGTPGQMPQGEHPLQITHGGNIIMTQVENEYGSFGRHAFCCAMT